MVLPNVFYTAGVYLEYLLSVLFQKISEVTESKTVFKMSWVDAINKSV